MICRGFFLSPRYPDRNLKRPYRMAVIIKQCPHIPAVFLLDAVPQTLTE